MWDPVLFSTFSTLGFLISVLTLFLFLAIEDNPDTGCYFVGKGGFPNSKGVLECDAAVMAGKKCRFGAVAALQGYVRIMNIYTVKF